MIYLVIAYVLIALVLAGYVASVVRRTRSVERTLQRMDAHEPTH